MPYWLEVCVSPATGYVTPSVHINTPYQHATNIPFRLLLALLYSSFALLMLWPHLQLSLQRDFSRSIGLEDTERRVMLGSGERRQRKVSGTVPHDLGSPTEAPWARTNAYNFQVDAIYHRTTSY